MTYNQSGEMGTRRRMQHRVSTLLAGRTPVRCLCTCQRLTSGPGLEMKPRFEPMTRGIVVAGLEVPINEVQSAAGLVRFLGEQTIPLT